MIWHLVLAEVSASGHAGWLSPDWQARQWGEKGISYRGDLRKGAGVSDKVTYWKHWTDRSTN